MQPKSPALLVCLAAPEDAIWLLQWERHLLPLQRAGYLRLWSERLLMGGEERLQQMNLHLDQANLIIFLLSPDFFASDECITLVERALARQHDEHVTLVPLLLRPSTWQDSPLGLLACLPSQAQAVTSSDDVDEAFQICVEGIRQILGLPVREGAQKRPISLPLKQRLQVIRGLRQEYRQRLDHSLQGQVTITLGLHERKDVIASSARLVFHDTEAEHPLLAGTTIVQIYDRAQFGLLILGAPGAGKTTLLLNLALELLGRAENDAEHPLPIILSLSSWATKRLALADWLSEQLYLVYGLAKKMGASWVEHDQVLLLLDGLDEMEPSTHSACVAAINHYRAEHFVPLVVASRSWEYEQQRARLILPLAVEIQPLEPEEVMMYLTQAGPTLATARAVVQTNPTLQRIMTTPLILMMVLLTYRNQEARELPQRGLQISQRRQVFEHYVQHMLKRYQQRRIFSLSQTSYSLIWLAKQMQRHHLTDFHLESLRVDWLSTAYTRTTYRLIVGLVAGLVGWLVGWLSMGLVVGLVFGLVSGLVVGLVVGLVFGLVVGLIDIQLAEKVVWSWKRSGKGLGIGFVVGSLFGLDSGLSAGLALGVIFGLIGALFGGVSGASLTQNMRHKPNQGIHMSGWNALRFGLLFFLVVGLIVGLASWLADGPIVGLVFGMMLGPIFGLVGTLLFGGAAYVQHYVLRLFLALNRTLPWRTVLFLEEASDCILLQRMGGGYQFIHPLLQEHFASLDVDALVGQNPQTRFPE